MSHPIDTDSVDRNLHELQRTLTSRLESIDGRAKFLADKWGKEDSGGTSMVLGDGAVFERAGVNFSRVRGPRLPSTASERHPELAGAPFEVRGVSVVVHPQNPYVPTSHMNVRLFTVLGDKPTYWFGGGFDLTPYYGFEDDARDFHRAAKQACDLLHKDAYARFKKTCDDYFFIKHRAEPRGIGGIFFDDLGPNEPLTGSFSQGAGFIDAVGKAFTDIYCRIVERRLGMPYGDAQRQWQLYRRGRYVEFNLVYDRGTTFGLQTGGRTESILMSLPPLVRWVYDHKPTPGSEEARLYSDFLRPRAWLDE